MSDDREMCCPYCMKPEDDCKCRWFPQESQTRPMLTAKQARVLLFIAKRQQTHISPTFREICRYLRVRAPNTAWGYLAALEKKGYIRRERYQSRAITILALPQ